MNRTATFEELAYRVIRAATQLEDKVDEILARSVCHDTADVIFVRQEFFGARGLSYEDRKKALASLLKLRYPNLSAKYEDIFKGHGLQRVQVLRNNLAHRTWRQSGVPETAEWSSAYGLYDYFLHASVYLEATAGTFRQGAYKTNSLTRDDLEEGIRIANELDNRLSQLFDDLKAERRSSGSERPLDRELGYPMTDEAQPLEW